MQVKHLVDYRLKLGSDLGTENDFSNISLLSEYPTKRLWGEGGGGDTTINNLYGYVPL